MSKIKFMTIFYTLSVSLLYTECENPENNITSTFLSAAKCEELLMEYAVLTANFTKCFIQHARPITVCQNCVEKYYKVVESYQNITKLKDETTGEVCKMILMNVDRLEVIEESFKYVTNEWKKAYCYKCFDSNSTDLNSNTKEILSLHNSTQSCIQSKNGGNMTCNASSTACVDCVEYYRLLNDFYDDHQSYNGFCMDIIDMMNVTRYNWSSVLCCCSDRRKPAPLYVFLYGSVFLIPVIFYLFVWFSSTSAPQQITYQSRWTQRFMQRSKQNPAERLDDPSSSSSAVQT